MSFGQKARIFAGPMVGSVTNNSAKVWIGYYGKGKQILVLTDTISNRIFYPSSVSVYCLSFDLNIFQSF